MEKKNQMRKKVISHKERILLTPVLLFHRIKDQEVSHLIRARLPAHKFPEI